MITEKCDYSIVHMTNNVFYILLLHRSISYYCGMLAVKSITVELTPIFTATVKVEINAFFKLI